MEAEYQLDGLVLLNIPKPMRFTRYVNVKLLSLAHTSFHLLQYPRAPSFYPFAGLAGKLEKFDFRV